MQPPMKTTTVDLKGYDWERCDHEGIGKGGSVVYVTGRTRGRALWKEYGDRVSLAEWLRWQARARRLE